jgi:hypothetical protein
LLAFGFVIATAAFLPPAAQAAGCLSGSTTNTGSLFWRETTKYGDRDTDVYHIQHVRELQHRLKRAGLFAAHQPTGNFYSYTKSELIKFQRRNNLCGTGVADQQTWRVLIKKTTKGFGRVPAGCEGSGWWVCYDRTLHELFAYQDGKIRNVWLVRGGSYSEPTRPGTFRVFAKYSYKLSTAYGTGCVSLRGRLFRVFRSCGEADVGDAGGVVAGQVAFFLVARLVVAHVVVEVPVDDDGA